MNKSLFFFLPVAAFLCFSSCSNQKAEIAELDKLIAFSDAAKADLGVIDTNEVVTLMQTSTDIKEQFKATVKDDTLDLVFAEGLNRFLLANKQLRGLNKQLRECLTANAAAGKRIWQLRNDIAAGSGDRSKYAEYVHAETKEMTAIRNHSSELKRRFESAKSAIGQFQPEIERFISQFVSP
jgi:chromosome segregation ATPase